MPPPPREFAGFEFIGCAVRPPLLIGLWGMKPDVDDPLATNPHAMLFYDLEDKHWSLRGGGEATGFHGCGIEHPEPKWVAVFDDGVVYAVGSGSEGMEKKVAPKRFFANVKSVAGRAYAVGSSGAVYRRDAKNKWKQLAGTPKLIFDDIAGISEKELYACGDKQLWHYNGKRWSQIALPSGLEPAEICVGNGNIYMSANQNWIVTKPTTGPTKRWTKISISKREAPESIACYQDRLYVATGERLLELRGDKLVPAKIGKPKLEWIEYLAAGGPLLVAAGGKQASFYDGKAWKKLV